MGRPCPTANRSIRVGAADLAAEPSQAIMAADDGVPDLSAFQLEVARLFFALPDSRGFLLAGGAALLAQHLTARPTEDLDFFTAPERGACSCRARCAGGRGHPVWLVGAANP
jgi:hypothetical protein